MSPSPTSSTRRQVLPGQRRRRIVLQHHQVVLITRSRPKPAVRMRSGRVHWNDFVRTRGILGSDGDLLERHQRPLARAHAVLLRDDGPRLRYSRRTGIAAGAWGPGRVDEQDRRREVAPAGPQQRGTDGGAGARGEADTARSGRAAAPKDPAEHLRARVTRTGRCGAPLHMGAGVLHTRISLGRGECLSTGRSPCAAGRGREGRDHGRGHGGSPSRLAENVLPAKLCAEIRNQLSSQAVIVMIPAYHGTESRASSGIDELLRGRCGGAVVHRFPPPEPDPPRLQAVRRDLLSLFYRHLRAWQVRR